MGMEKQTKVTASVIISTVYYYYVRFWGSDMSI